ncbi:MAG: TauD/TfdA family dioxygenase [Actinomycetota bacterium]
MSDLAMALTDETPSDFGDAPASGADALTVDRLSPSLGAEVRGLALADAGPDEVALIDRLLVEHMVLFFPEQQLTLDQHVTLGARFGPLEGHPNLKNPFTDRDEIFEIAASRGGVADEWHTDLTFRESPSVLSILNMVECPDTGGDTMWANLCDAYDALSAPMQELCNGLTALHDAQAHKRPERMAVHPVVRVHPVTGRRALYVNQHFTRRIVELDHRESDALLGLLTQWVAQDEFTVRYRWSKGTVAMWDNRCTQHRVVNDFGGERLIQRVTVSGDRPEGDEPRWAPHPKHGGALSRFDWQLHDFLENGTG